MTRRPVTLAIPGDIDTLTGGYIYEKRLLHGLRDIGHDVRHLRLGGSYPDPTSRDMTEAIDALCAVGPDRVLLLDGFVSGATETAGLARVQAPMVAIVHHPLAMENGLSDRRRAHLFRTEYDNLALVDHVLVPSPYTASLLTADYDIAPDKITVARPGPTAVVGIGDPAHPPLILSVGILHPRKGHDVLLRALAQITDLDWQSVIVGSRLDPAHVTDLVALRRDLGLGARVRLAGTISQTRLNALFREASVFALATRFEGYGIVFDEALAAGLPIVTCRTGAVPDTVPDAAGLLVPPDDPAAFAAALRSLLSDTRRRAALAASARRAGMALPGLSETSRIASTVLDAARPAS